MKEPMEKGGPVADQPLPQPKAFTNHELIYAQAWSWATSNENGQHAKEKPIIGESVEEFRSKEEFYARLAATLAELAQLRNENASLKRRVEALDRALTDATQTWEDET